MVCQMCLHRVECLQIEVDQLFHHEVHAVAVEVKLHSGVHSVVTIVTELVICHAIVRSQTNAASLLVDTAKTSTDRRRAANRVDAIVVKKPVIF